MRFDSTGAASIDSLEPVNGKHLRFERARRSRLLRSLLLGAWAALFACGDEAEGPRVEYVTLGGVACADGAVACGEVCAELASDVEHCGACGNVCPVGSICDVGRCRASSDGCSGALALCERDCVDLQTADAHCGACETACPADAECTAGSCVCPGLLAACGDACVDTSSDAQNCGACEQRCVDTQTCENGGCQCPLGSLLCNVSTLTVADGAVSGAAVVQACADIQSDAQNCGACGVACTGGQRCDQGACACPAAQTLCDGSCVDTQTTAPHCGSCGNACTEGHICSDGSCVCPEGQTSCDGACVDTQSDAQNCGACGVACAFGQGCSEGGCSSGALGEDGCQGLATGLSISEVAAYQTVKVTLARDGESVEPEPSMVAQRRTLFRVFVETGDGWVPRQLSGRLFLQNGEAVSTHYSEVVSIAQSSQDADRASTFEFRIAPELITPETRYAVEVVECGAPAVGATERPRFPATDAAELGAIATGRLRVHLVPMRSNGLLPDTSQAVLDLFEAAFLDTYPVAEVELSVGEPFDIANALDWNGNLNRLAALRQREAPDPAVYYYGMLKPADTLEEFCGQGCVAGVGFIAQPPLNQFPRASMGLSFADVTSAFTMLHEVGHNHGRNHAPCAPGGQITGVDPDYPQQNGTTGVYGYDSLGDQLLPPNATDLMGYCDNKWLSAYTYDGLLQNVLAVNRFQPLGVVDRERIAAWRVLLVDVPFGSRWGIPADQPRAATGVEEKAEILDAAGAVITEVSVYRSTLSDIDAYSIEVPPPQPGWHSIRVSGAAPLAFAP